MRHARAAPFRDPAWCVAPIPQAEEADRDEEIRGTWRTMSVGMANHRGAGYLHEFGLVGVHRVDGSRLR